MIFPSLPSTMSDFSHPLVPATPFSAADAAAVYRAIYERRDMRHFSGGTVDPAVLLRLLDAAHHAPSVGFMQPWRFIRVSQRATRERLHQMVEAERLQTAQFLGQRQEDFMRLKVQGLLDAAEVLVVALADGREQHVFGRRTMPAMDLASSACAIQNLWLAARAEGLGLGWVSLFEPEAVAQLLHMPAGAEPIALLCLGPVAGYYSEPMLQQERWARRAALAGLVYDDLWGQSSDLFELPLVDDLGDAELTAQLQHALDNKTKPQGSLGRIEAVALQIGQILGSTVPVLEAPQMVVFAGDHGLTARGVSAFPSDVTWQMVENFLAGGAAVSVLSRQNGIALTVVDCGVKHDFLAGLPAGTQRAGLQVRKVAGAEQGTANSAEQPAMTAQQCREAMQQGCDLVRNLPGNALLLGEMGIGNTSAASLLLARLTGLDIVQCTGAGTGLDAAAVQRKVAVLREVLERHAQATQPLEALAALGGFEIATMVGAVLQAAQERRVIVVDGFIASSAVLVAHALQPLVLQRCLFAHRSGERGHEFMLQHLGVQALLDLGLRLGEGSGAALVWPLLQSACTVLRDMASFAAAGVSEKSVEPTAP